MAAQKLSKLLITARFCRGIGREYQLHKDSLITSSLIANFKRYRDTPVNLINAAEENLNINLFEFATNVKIT